MLYLISSILCKQSLLNQTHWTFLNNPEYFSNLLLSRANVQCFRLTRQSMIGGQCQRKSSVFTGCSDSSKLKMIVPRTGFILGNSSVASSWNPHDIAGKFHNINSVFIRSLSFCHNSWKLSAGLFYVLAVGDTLSENLRVHSASMLKACHKYLAFLCSPTVKF